MTTLSDLRNRCLRILGDDTGSQFSDELLNDGVMAALDAILSWYPKSQTLVCEGDDEKTSFDLPADFYRIAAVFDSNTGMYIPAATMAPFQSPGGNIEANQDYLEFPDGSIVFANALVAETSCTVYYYASWPHVTEDDDLNDWVIPTPIWLDTALALYTSSYALLQKASQSSNIRQWNVDVDSGTPAMNPMRDQSGYLMERFAIEMNRIPARMRGVRG